jgi:hypothetical protein
MIDSDLARFYKIETKQFNRAVKRNIERFPDFFMFQLTEEEWNILRCQIGTLKDSKEWDNLKYQIGTSSWGGK